MTALFILLSILLLAGAIGLLIASFRLRQPLFRPAALGVGVLAILLFTVALCLVSVAPNERMVVFNRVNGELGDPKEPGLHVINPLTTSYRIYDVSRQTYTMSAVTFEGDVQGDDAVEARTSDGQQVNVEISLIYNISPERINEVHQKWPNERYRTELIRPQMRSIIRDVLGGFDVQGTYQKRDEIDTALTEHITEKLNPEGLDVVDILIRDITFTEEYTQSIENAQIAEVGIQTVENEAAQAEKRAEGIANARVIEAEGEAQALALVAEVLANNPALLQYQYVANLSDNVQIIALPANSPYIFDLQALMQNSSAPQAETSDN